MAEIESLIDSIPYFPTIAEKEAYRGGVYGACCKIYSLEVKEVDLEKEIKEEYLKRRYYGGRDNMLVILNEPQFHEIAKHFFELGLKAQKGE